MVMEQRTTRRSGLVSGAKLAFVAPAVVAALRAGVASADSPAVSDNVASSPSPGESQGLQKLFQEGLCATSGNGRALVQVFGANNTPSAVHVVFHAAANTTYS